MKPSLARLAPLASATSRYNHCPVMCVVPTLQITGARSALGRNTQGEAAICSPLDT